MSKIVARYFKNLPVQEVVLMSKGTPARTLILTEALTFEGSLHRIYRVTGVRGLPLRFQWLVDTFRSDQAAALEAFAELAPVTQLKRSTYPTYTQDAYPKDQS